MIQYDYTIGECWSHG